MVFEKWDAKFDVSALQKHLEEFVLPLEPTTQSVAFSGWSIWSSTGSYKDGWHKGNLAVTKDGDTSTIIENLEKMGAKISTAYTIPTEICRGYLSEVMEVIKSKNLNPRRARIIRLHSNQSTIWHRDAPEDTYAVRLHIPIVTNSKCFFETRTEKAFLPADGSAYFLSVSTEHRVVNGSDSMRYHIVMDITDNDKFTKFHHTIAGNR